MTNKDLILSQVKEIHQLVENDAFVEHDLIKRQQLILADLSLHLIQAALRNNHPDPDDLKRYLYSVLTVSDQFIPDMDLKAIAEQFMKDIPQ